MKAKLIKTGNDYLLKEYGYGETLVITSATMEGRKLSLKNCQAIERGYDLDELAETFAKNHSIYPTAQDDTEYGFKYGFQKALEILGDKKFTENDIDEAFDAGYEMLDSPKNYNDVLKEFKESLEPTECDVEIEIEVINHGKGEDGLLQETIEPKLDENGCLILKRMSILV